MYLVDKRLRAPAAVVPAMFLLFFAPACAGGGSGGGRDSIASPGSPGEGPTASSAGQQAGRSADQPNAGSPEHATPRPGEAGSQGRADAPKAPPVERRSLLAEAPRAELDAGGPVIDFGTADQHKYTLGGWQTGWGALGRDGAVSYGSVADQSAKLHFLLRAHPQELVVRLRSSLSGQKVWLKHGKGTLGSADVGKQWTVVRIKASALPRHGITTIELKFRRGNRNGAVADVDWLWLSSAQDGPPPASLERVAEMELGGSRKSALLAPGARSYSFYLQPRADSKLRLAYGADGQAKFSVSAQTTDDQTHPLLDESTTGGSWVPAEIDLSPFAGHVIRLELATSGSSARAGWAEPAIVRPAPASNEKTRPDSGKRPKNVVFILMDTCRADMYSTVNPDSKVNLPAFDAFAKRSVAFSNDFDNESWTLPSTATLMSGVYPFTHGALFLKSEVPDSLELLSEYLKGHGFHTGLISANVFVGPKYGLNQGWDSVTQLVHTEREKGEFLYEDATKWLEANAAGGPFFLWLQVMDCHSPYQPTREFSEPYHPEPYHGKFGPAIESKELGQIQRHELRPNKADWAWIRALYHGEATYQDQHMGVFLAAVEKMGLLDDTLVVITNDHGEEMGDHGSVGHQVTSYDELLRAPLLMSFPPLFPPGHVVDEIVEQVDVAPTIVDALGLPPMPNAQGSSLLPLIADKSERLRPYYAISDHRDRSHIMHVGHWKLTVAESGIWQSLYDLRADRGEKVDRRRDAVLAGRFAEIYLGEALAVPNKKQRLFAAPKTEP